jgi:hypothetical protein
VLQDEVVLGLGQDLLEDVMLGSGVVIDQVLNAAAVEPAEGEWAVEGGLLFEALLKLGVEVCIHDVLV